MLPDGTIDARHLWKRFRADRSRPILRDHIEQLRTRKRPAAGSARWRWALRDVSLHVDPGEAVGLFGSNGSGKSTLLKLLTRVMWPYAGRLDVTGRVGALIEVRAGIHPDLSGRENVYLYGSLLGLGRAEVSRRFDRIVDFAELEEAVDRPIKYYSSGMQMRLGFGVAAFLEPDILLVDEVLAVGDASFQQKCLDRMRDVIAEGTSLVFVSHDLPTIEATCTRGVWLADGAVRVDGPVREALAAYRESIELRAEASPSDGPVRLLSATVSPAGAGPVSSLEPAVIDVVLGADAARDAILCLGVSEGPAAPVFVVRTRVRLEAGETSTQCRLASLPLPRGRFFLWAAALDGEDRDLMRWHPAGSFSVVGPDLPACPPGVMRLGPVYVDADWEVAVPAPEGTLGSDAR